MTYVTQYFFQQLARLARRADDERGAAMVEYALLIALIAAVCITVLGTLGTNVSGLFGHVANNVSNVPG